MATTPLDAVQTTSDSYPANFAISSGVNRKAYLAVVRTSGTDANPPTAASIGGVSVSPLAVADDGASMDVVVALFEWTEAQIASMSGTAVTVTGGGGANYATLYWSVQGAVQSATTVNTGITAGTSGAVSLVRVADSYTYAITVHDIGSGSYSSLTNPAQSGTFNITNGVIAYGLAADTARTADFTWAHSFSRENAVVVINIPPAAADEIPPTLSSAVIGTNGTTVTLNFSEAVTTGAGGTSGFTLSASGGAVTLSHSSTSGTSIVYTASRTIAASETVTISYTQPGNGVEDISGNDLATFTGTSVTNNSTQGSGPVITSVTPTAPLHLGTFDVVGTDLPTGQAGSVAFNFVGAIATVALGITFGTATALSAAMDIGNNRYGVAGNLVVVNSAGTASANYAVTPVPRSGGKYINLSGTLADVADRLIAVPDLAAGHQVEIYGVEGGTIDDVELFEDGSVAWVLGVTGFWARAHNGTAWGEPAWQATVPAPAASGVRRYSISYSIRG